MKIPTSTERYSIHVPVPGCHCFLMISLDISGFFLSLSVRPFGPRFCRPAIRNLFSLEATIVSLTCLKNSSACINRSLKPLGGGVDLISKTLGFKHTWRPNTTLPELWSQLLGKEHLVTATAVPTAILPFEQTEVALTGFYLLSIVC